MKKIIALIFAAITMMISCVGPLMVKANAATVDLSTFDNFVSHSGFNRSKDNYYYLYFTFNAVHDGQPYVTGVSISFPKDGFYDSSGDYDLFTFNDNVLTITNGNTNAIYCAYSNTNMSGTYNSEYEYGVTLDFNNNTGYLLYKRNNGTFVNEGFYYGDITNFTFENYSTNLDEFQPLNPLDLDISFKPTLSGEISRKQTIDGKEYTSTTLDMYVSNNGSSDSQFAMFIVPRGDSITFPDHMIQDNKGFIGNPVFVYVSDEWSSFTAGLVGSSVYAPCSWHTVPKGFQNQLYSISWNQMSLQPDTQYDCVVYGCVNSTATQTNTSSQWEMRPVYTVTSSLDDVEEVYRSSFTITDPAEFNPNFIDEAGASHPWNPNADNSNLFNVASAYRDDNGNVVIKGQTGGGNNIFTADLNTQSMNVNNLFGDTFRFFTALLGQLPPAWVALITIGLSSIVVIAIVKKVTS